jgi:hypothetical protein
MSQAANRIFNMIFDEYQWSLIFDMGLMRTSKKYTVEVLLVKARKI